MIGKNRSRKLTKHKILSNNTLIEIDACSPLELLKLQVNLKKIADEEGIAFVTGKGNVIKTLISVGMFLLGLEGIKICQFLPALLKFS